MKPKERIPNLPVTLIALALDEKPYPPMPTLHVPKPPPITDIIQTKFPSENNEIVPLVPRDPECPEFPQLPDRFIPKAKNVFNVESRFPMEIY